jgi:hypothetical protein
MALPKLTNFAQIARVARKSKDIDVPEWGVEAHIVELTSEELDKWNSSVFKTKGARVTSVSLSGQTARLVALAVRDPETGERIFADSDIPAIQRLPAAGGNRIAKVARELSLIQDENEDEEDPAEANLEPSLNGNSNIVSPVT